MKKHSIDEIIFERGESNFNPNKYQSWKTSIVESIGDYILREDIHGYLKRNDIHHMMKILNRLPEPTNVHVDTNEKCVVFEMVIPEIESKFSFIFYYKQNEDILLVSCTPTNNNKISSYKQHIIGSYKSPLMNHNRKVLDIVNGKDDDYDF